MLSVDIHTLPHIFSTLGRQLQIINEMKRPRFTQYQPNYELLYSLAAKYASTTHFIIIGRGGSVTGFRALYESLAAHKTTKRVHILDTVDPDALAHLRTTCHPEDSLVIAISKSGRTVDVIENLLCFPEYKRLVITENRDGPLAKIAIAKELEIVEHPAIGGRFSTGTECALVPAALIYIDIKSFVDGMRSMREACDPSRPIEQNPALQVAAALLLAEHMGKTEVYAPIYHKSLTGVSELATQLLHESACKQGKGQTFLFMEAPECQHHTNQKFYDGPPRMVGLFTRVERSEDDCTLHVEPGLRSLDPLLESIDGESLTTALWCEYDGVRLAADEHDIPNATITLDVLNPGTLGELVAFWEYVAVYSALLRGVNPYDQPGVEASKQHSRQRREEAAVKRRNGQ